MQGFTHHKFILEGINHLYKEVFLDIVMGKCMLNWLLFREFISLLNLLKVKMIRKRRFSILLFTGLMLAMSFQAIAQVSIADSAISLVALDVSYRGGIPTGGWQPAWGYTSWLGLDVSFKSKSHWYLSFGAHFLFADNVQIDSALKAITTPEGLLITDDGQLSGFELLGTGMVVPVSVGKLFPIQPERPNSGIYVEVGSQYLQHKIRVRALDGRVASLRGAYAKGYDRLRGAIGFQQGIGYRFFANNGNLNFAVGLAASQVRTVSLRTIYFPTGDQELNPRWDLWWGLRVSWTYPLYNRAPNKRYFY